MNTDIGQRWTDYCMLISETARRFSNASTSPNDEITAALNRFVKSDPPKTEAELGIKFGEGDQLQADWKVAYADCENHESIPAPTQCMAEQAEMAKSENTDSDKP